VEKIPMSLVEGNLSSQYKVFFEKSKIQNFYDFGRTFINKYGKESPLKFYVGQIQLLDLESESPSS
jgi:hypothetical protein